MRPLLPSPWLGLLLWGGLLGSHAQAAEPLLTRIEAPDALRSDFYAMTESADGALYFGDNGKLMRFDGAHWRDVPVPDPGPVRSLHTDRAGRIWVGAFNVPGYLASRLDGGDRFVALDCGEPCRGDGAGLSDIWMMAENDDGIFMQTLRDLLWFDHAGQLRGHWHHDGRFGDILAVADGLYVQFRGSGLRLLRDGEFEPVAGGGQFAAGRINTLQRLADGSLLLLDTEGRVGRLLDGGSFVALGLDPEIVRHLEHARLIGGVAAFPGDDGVLRMIDPYNASVRPIVLGNQFLSDLSVDRHGRIGVVDRSGVTFLHWPPEGERFGPADGLLGQFGRLVRQAGTLHVLGTAGDFRLQLDDIAAGAVSTGWSQGEAWDLLRLDDGMLLAESFGLRWIDASGSQLVGPDDLYPRRLLRARAQPDRVWVGTEHGVALLKHDAVGLRLSARSDDGAFDIRSLVELDDGRVLAGSDRDGVWVVEAGESEVSLRSTRLPLPDGVTGPAWVGKVGEHTLASAAGRIYALQGERAVATQLDGLAALLDEDEVPVIVDGVGGARWAFDLDSVFHFRPGRGWIELTSAAHDAGGLNDLLPDDEGGAWLAGSDAVVHLQRPEPDAPTPAQLRIAAVTWSGAEERQGLLPLAGDAIAPASTNSLRFDVALRDFQRGPPAEYRMRIRELGHAFPDWSTVPSLLTGALPPGTYQFEAEARRARGGRIARANYGFEIEPAWHQRLDIRLLAGLAVFGAGVAWASRRARRQARALAADNIALEALVRTRTLDLEVANRRLQDLAESDGLTGVGNRRLFDRALDAALHRAEKLDHPLCLLLCDVDLFKQYNDEHGHLAGDDLLRKLAQTLLRQVREDTIVARYGGEEFALIAQDCDLGRARFLADRVRDAVSRDLAPTTISVGVAEWRKPGDPAAETLIQRADDALYRAKDGGRNQVVCAT
ncbi:MAG: diguanylate cyclase [Xanthomonadales bacterium]|nr:diguanylate cyclase [Xanthomonadales bacterium]